MPKDENISPQDKEGRRIAREKRQEEERRVRLELGKQEMMAKAPEIHSQVLAQMPTLNNFLYPSEKVEQRMHELEKDAQSATDLRNKTLMLSGNSPRRWKEGYAPKKQTPGASVSFTNTRDGGIHRANSMSALPPITSDTTATQRKRAMSYGTSADGDEDALEDPNAETLPSRFLGPDRKGLSPSAPTELRAQLADFIDLSLLSSALRDKYVSALVHPVASASPKLRSFPQNTTTGNADASYVSRFQNGTRWFLLPFFSTESVLPSPPVIEALRLVGQSCFVQLLEGKIVEAILPDFGGSPSYKIFEQFCSDSGVFVFFGVAVASGRLEREMQMLPTSSFAFCLELVDESHAEFLLMHCMSSFAISFGPNVASNSAKADNSSLDSKAPDEENRAVFCSGGGPGHEHPYYVNTIVVVLRKPDVLAELVRQIYSQGLYVCGMKIYYPDNPEEVEQIPSILKSHIWCGTRDGEKIGDNLPPVDSTTNVCNDPIAVSIADGNSVREGGADGRNFLIAFRGAGSYDRLCNIIGPAPDIARTTDPYSLNARFGGESREDIVASPPARGFVDLAWAFGGRLSSVQELWRFAVTGGDKSHLINTSSIRTKTDLKQVLRDLLDQTLKGGSRSTYSELKRNRARICIAGAVPCPLFATQALHVLPEEFYSIALSKDPLHPNELLDRLQTFIKLHEPSKLFSIIPTKIPVSSRGLHELLAPSKISEDLDSVSALGRKKADQKRLDQIAGQGVHNKGNSAKARSESMLVGTGKREGGVSLLPRDLGLLALEEIALLPDLGTKVAALSERDCIQIAAEKDEMQEVCVGILDLGGRILDQDLKKLVLTVCVGREESATLSEPSPKKTGPKKAHDYGGNVELVNIRIVNGSELKPDVGVNCEKMDDLNPGLWTHVETLCGLFIVAVWRGEDCFNQVRLATRGTLADRSVKQPSPGKSPAISSGPGSDRSVSPQRIPKLALSRGTPSVASTSTAREWQLSETMEESYLLYKIFFGHVTLSSSDPERDLSSSCFCPYLSNLDLRYFGRYTTFWSRFNTGELRSWDVSPSILFHQLCDDIEIPESVCLRLGDVPTSSPRLGSQSTNRLSRLLTTALQKDDRPKLIFGEQVSFCFCDEVHLSRVLLQLTHKHKFVVEKLVLTTPGNGFPHEWLDFLFDQDSRDEFLMDPADRVPFFDSLRNKKSALILLSRRANACRTLQRLLGHGDPRENKRRDYVTLRRGNSRVDCGVRCTSSASTTQEFWQRWCRDKFLIEFCEEHQEHFYLGLATKHDICGRFFISVTLAEESGPQDSHRLAETLDTIGEVQDSDSHVQILITEEANQSSKKKCRVSHDKIIVIMVFYILPSCDGDDDPYSDLKRRGIVVLEKLQERTCRADQTQSPIFHASERADLDSYFFKR